MGENNFSLASCMMHESVVKVDVELATSVLLLPWGIDSSTDYGPRLQPCERDNRRNHRSHHSSGQELRKGHLPSSLGGNGLTGRDGSPRNAVGVMQLEVIQWFLNIGNAGRRASVPRTTRPCAAVTLLLTPVVPSPLFFISVQL
jgi:hypothetical protein